VSEVTLGVWAAFLSYQFLALPGKPARSSHSGLLINFKCYLEKAPKLPLFIFK
jgi:hypothetical protein